MTCHRPGARHCSCAPEGDSRDDLLALRTGDPDAVHALRMLAARAGVEAVTTADGVVEVRGGLASLLTATLASMPAALPGGLPAGATWAPMDVVAGRRVVPLVNLLRRAELIAMLDTEFAHQRAGTTTGVVFCDVSAGDGRTHAQVLGIAAARLQGSLRRSDTLAHLGDGCFVAVLADLVADRAEETASRIAATLRSCFDEPIAAPAGLVAVAPLVGVLVHPGPRGPAAGEPGDVAAAPTMTGAALVAAIERSLSRGSDVEA